jgi:hypothetical protein
MDEKLQVSVQSLTPPQNSLDQGSVEAAARAKRHAIAFEAGVSELAQGTAASIQPTDAVEEMLSDVMTAAYNGAMRLIWRASTNGHVKEIAMLTRASAQMMTCFTDAVATLQKLRSGGRQSILVQHVAVQPGGQAVIAGNIRGSSRPGGKEKARG